jgi:uncharacterized protein YqgV (UPF0045/DUF77 family)
MIAEISVVPQKDGPARELISKVVSEIASEDLEYRVGAAGTTVQGELESIFDAVRRVRDCLHAEGVDRAVVDLRLQFEPHPETLQHQVEGIGPAAI